MYDRLHLDRLPRRYTLGGAIELVARQGRHGACSLTVSPNAHGRDLGCQLELPAAGRVSRRWQLRDSVRWYDFSVTSPELPGWSERFAGRLETGRDGFSDPALGER